MLIKKMAYAALFLLAIANSAFGQSTSTPNPAVGQSTSIPNSTIDTSKVPTFSHVSQATWAKTEYLPDCRKYTSQLFPSLQTEIKDCETGYVWDRENFKCDLAANVPKCLSNGTWVYGPEDVQPKIEPTPLISNTSVDTSKVPLPTFDHTAEATWGKTAYLPDCRKYKSKVFPLMNIEIKDCDTGYVWDRDNYKCDEAAKVPKCLTNGTWVYGAEDAEYHDQDES